MIKNSCALKSIADIRDSSLPSIMSNIKLFITYEEESQGKLLFIVNIMTIDHVSLKLPHLAILSADDTVTEATLHGAHHLRCPHH